MANVTRILRSLFFYRIRRKLSSLRAKFKRKLSFPFKELIKKEHFESLFRSSLSSAFGFLFLAVCLGWFAWTATTDWVKKDWENRHFPSEFLIEQTLKGIGYKRCSELPKQWKDGGGERSLAGVWRTKDYRGVYFSFLTLFDEDESGFFQLSKQEAVSREWVYLGPGWAGFEAFLESFPESLPKQKSVRIRNKNGRRSDPRALIY